jgi:hypothetical protein
LTKITSLWQSTAAVGIVSFMNPDRRAKVVQLLTVVVFSIILGRLTVQSSGDGWGWAGIILGVVAVAMFSYLLLRDFWKPNV